MHHHYGLFEEDIELEDFVYKLPFDSIVLQSFYATSIADFHAQLCGTTIENADFAREILWNTVDGCCKNELDIWSPEYRGTVKPGDE